MSWNQTHLRWQALQEIEAMADAGCTELPWNDDYAAIFGDRDGLVAVLRYRWHLSQSTQLDTHLSERVLEEQRARLEARHAGILRMVQNHGAGVPAQRRETLTVVPQHPVAPTDRVPA
ncbi:MAG: hypothetical protein ACJ72D_13350 [Marmoricola sp.]